MNDLSLYKVPPQSLESEDSILCSCILNPEHLETALTKLSPEDFYRSAHQKIFSAMISLHQEKSPVDMNTLVVKMRDNLYLEECGGASYIASLTEIPMAVNVGHYCDIIKQRATMRRLIAAGNEICGLGFDSTSETLAEDVDKAHALITDIALDATETKYVTAEELMLQTTDRYEGMNSGANKDGIKTGFFEIDLLTGGFRRSRLIVIAARPRMGKTALMLNMAANMCKAGHRVGIFSIEMDKEELSDRMVSSETGINSVRLSMGNGPNVDEWEKILEAQAKISRFKMRIDDTGGIPIKELKARIRGMKKEGAEIVFIDQLSKIRATGNGGRFEQATEIVEELAWLKKELRMPIVLLAQINRKAEERVNRKPTLADLKNTGQIEEDADIVLLGNRAYEYTKDPKDELEATWELAKHRGGPCRNIHLKWYAKITTFKDGDNNGT